MVVAEARVSALMCSVPVCLSINIALGRPTVSKDVKEIANLFPFWNASLTLSSINGMTESRSQGTLTWIGGNSVRRSMLVAADKVRTAMVEIIEICVVSGVELEVWS